MICRLATVALFEPQVPIEMFLCAALWDAAVRFSFLFICLKMRPFSACFLIPVDKPILGHLQSGDDMLRVQVVNHTSGPAGGLVTSEKHASSRKPQQFKELFSQSNGIKLRHQ